MHPLCSHTLCIIPQEDYELLFKTFLHGLLKDIADAKIYC